MLEPNENEDFASSIEIDAKLNAHIDYFLRLKDVSLRNAYERFNGNNQTLSSLFLLGIVILIFSIPFELMLILTVDECQTALEYFGWVVTVVVILMINILIWKEYIVQRDSIARNNGNLTPTARKTLQRFQSVVFVAVQCILCYRLFHKVMIVGSCDDISSLTNWNCNPGVPSKSLPDGVSVVTMMVPIFYATFVRGFVFELAMALWAISVITLVACVIYSSAVNSTEFVACYSVASFIILIETRRLNYFLFFTHLKLQDILKEREKAADVANAQEMRHMIANVAHDLKTPLSSFLSGIELISQVISELYDKKSTASSADIDDAVFTISQCVTNIRNTNSFMLMTINRCIDYTKASKGVKLVPRFETIDLNETLSLPLHCMRDIQQRVMIQMEPLPSKLCSHIITDKQWLQENLLCLLSNAVKYSNGGVVSIVASLTCRDGETCSGVDDGQGTPSKELSFRICEQSGGCEFIRFEVEDHGIGLSEDAMSTLFNPFKQAQRLAGGTGLGLFSLAKRIEALDGLCGVQRRRDGQEGSLFWFEIPYRPDRGAANMIGRSFGGNLKSSSSKKHITRSLSLKLPSRDNVSSSLFPVSNVASYGATGDTNRSSATELDDISTPPSGTEEISPSEVSIVQVSTPDDEMMTVLVVDDSPAILKMTSMMLKRHKHHVSTATNGAEAVKMVNERLEATGKGFDVVLMDLQMPVMDGLEATRRLRAMEMINKEDKSAYHQIIIGVSANSDVDTANEARRVGVDAFMTKPFSLEMFYRTYDDIIDVPDRE